MKLKLQPKYSREQMRIVTYWLMEGTILTRTLDMIATESFVEQNFRKYVGKKYGLLNIAMMDAAISWMLNIPTLIQDLRKQILL
jgi:hypothetical protein